MAASESLKERVGFVTGGAQGLGRAFVGALLQNGANVAIIDINEDTGSKTEAEFAGKYGKEKVQFIKCDVMQLEDLRESYKKCREQFGNIEIVINNAGILDEINFEKLIDVNLKAVIRSSYMAAEHMRKDKGGKGGYIINIASVAGLSTYVFPYSIAYAAAKHGVVGFTKALAHNIEDTIQFGIHVAAICPSYIRTGLIDVDALSKLEPTREPDVTIPNFKGGLEEAVDFTRNAELIQEWIEPTKVADVMLALIADPGCNGAIVEVTTTTAKFLHPESYVGKDILILD